jgi:hypothetical protein
MTKAAIFICDAMGGILSPFPETVRPLSFEGPGQPTLVHTMVRPGYGRWALADMSKFWQLKRNIEAYLIWG